MNADKAIAKSQLQGQLITSKSEDRTATALLSAGDKLRRTLRLQVSKAEYHKEGHDIHKRMRQSCIQVRIG